MGEDDITQWIGGLAEGDEQAAQAIWQRYFERLMRLAERKLQGLPRRIADEEDVALSAMHSFFRGAAAGRFPRLEDREDLWKLLVTITCRKAVKQARRQRAQKRGGGYVRGNSAFLKSRAEEPVGGIEQVLGSQPTPDLACMMADTCSVLLKLLRDDTLRSIALHRMEGYSNEEIADKLGCTVRTVERRLARIRHRWQQEQ